MCLPDLMTPESRQAEPLRPELARRTGTSGLTEKANRSR